MVLKVEVRIGPDAVPVTWLIPESLIGREATPDSRAVLILGTHENSNADWWEARVTWQLTPLSLWGSLTDPICRHTSRTTQSWGLYADLYSSDIWNERVFVQCRWQSYNLTVNAITEGPFLVYDTKNRPLFIAVHTVSRALVQELDCLKVYFEEIKAEMNVLNHVYDKSIVL